MNVETLFRVKREYIDSIGDVVPDDMSKEEIDAVVEDHIMDYCYENKIPRECISIIEESDENNG